MLQCMIHIITTQSYSIYCSVIGKKIFERDASLQIIQKLNTHLHLSLKINRIVSNKLDIAL